MKLGISRPDGMRIDIEVRAKELTREQLEARVAEAVNKLKLPTPGGGSE